MAVWVDTLDEALGSSRPRDDFLRPTRSFCPRCAESPATVDNEPSRLRIEEEEESEG